MDKKHLFKQVEKLVSFINVIENDFEPITQRTPYYHMGATITDSILQAGLNYKTVVYPRVLELLTKYREYRTTSDFLILIQTIPIKTLIKWNNEVKIERIIRLSWFLYNNNIENENQLAIWLNTDTNIIKLINIDGVGPKTVDYLKMLSGVEAIAVDRHLFKFLELAGILIKSYQDANLIFTKAAESLNMSKYELDKKIWVFMTTYKLYPSISS